MSLSQRLKHRVAIEQPATGQDELGQPVPGWSTLATVWADIRYTNGAEAIRADAVGSKVRASVRIRRRTDVTSAMRVVHGVTVLQILAVLPDEQTRERIDLVCEVIA